MAAHTRSGGPSKLKLKRYAEALSDPIMENKGYTFEANYISVIWNWRRASDERGLSSLQRSRFNYKLLNLILEDLMPWYNNSYDFSRLEVNRYIFVLNAT